MDAGIGVEAGRLRRDVVAYLRAYGAPDADYGAAELVLGELLANAGRYTPGPVCVVIDWAGVLARAILHDGGRGFTWIPALPRDASERGRGLFIVSALALDVHVESSDYGCRVAVTLPIPRQVSGVPPTACPQARLPHAAGICHAPRNSARAATYLRSSDDRAARKDRTS